MNILYITHQFLPQYVAGTEILTYQTAKEFLNRGHQVHVFAGLKMSDRGLGEDKFDYYCYDNIPVYIYRYHWDIEDGQKNLMREEYYNPEVDNYLRGVIDRLKPDLVHIYHLHRLSVGIVDICKELAVPIVFTVTDYWPLCPTCQLLSHDGRLCSGPDKRMVNCIKHMAAFDKRGKVFRSMPDWLISLFVRKMGAFPWIDERYRSMVGALLERPAFIRKRIEKVDRLLVATSFMKQLLSRFGMGHERIEKVLFGVDQTGTEIDSPKGMKKELSIGFVGTLHYHKGAHVLCEAIRLLPKDIPVLAKIYGSQELFPDYVKHLRKIAGEDSRIYFCGTFSPDMIHDVFVDMDLLIVPSLWYENTPLVICSAQAARVPVVATDVGGISEVITDGENGLLFERGNAVQLARIIERLCRNRQTVKQLSENALTPPSVVSYADRLEQIYLDVAKRDSEDNNMIP